HPLSLLPYLSAPRRKNEGCSYFATIVYRCPRVSLQRICLGSVDLLLGFFRSITQPWCSQKNPSRHRQTLINHILCSNPSLIKLGDRLLLHQA
ncbi:hypothetical protein SERLADRAFT_459918, partial [Serpula lacrymans var. lacrymans S7.9]